MDLNSGISEPTYMTNELTAEVFRMLNSEFPGVKKIKGSSKKQTTVSLSQLTISNNNTIPKIPLVFINTLGWQNTEFKDISATVFEVEIPLPPYNDVKASDGGSTIERRLYILAKDEKHLQVEIADIKTLLNGIGELELWKKGSKAKIKQQDVSAYASLTHWANTITYMSDVDEFEGTFSLKHFLTEKEDIKDISSYFHKLELASWKGVKTIKNDSTNIARRKWRNKRKTTPTNHTQLTHIPVAKVKKDEISTVLIDIKDNGELLIPQTATIESLDKLTSADMRLKVQNKSSLKPAAKRTIK